MVGYRSMWLLLRSEGFRVPRSKVTSIQREPDPDGCKERRTHRLKRRVYINPGPIFVSTWMGMTDLNNLASLPWMHRWVHGLEFPVHP